MGNKYKLLSQILPYFPRNIKNFYDIFGGSAVVSMNVKAENYFVNDLSNHLYNLYDMFKTNSAKEIIDYCYQKRDEYGFITTSDREELKRNKEPYNKCREDINSNPSTLGYFFLTYYAFCNNFRFNNGKFNMPVGNGYFREECEIEIKNLCKFFSQDNVYISNLSYEQVIPEEDSFVYADLPYANTEAVYNDKREIAAWTEESDYAFFRYCENLNTKGIRFAISNVFRNKGAENKHLIDWCEKNNWVVHHLNMKYAGHSFETANMQTDEVLICNYVNEDMNCLF